MKRANSPKMLVKQGFQLFLTVCCVLALAFTWQTPLLAESSVTKDVYPYRSENSEITTKNNLPNRGEDLQQNAKSAVDRVAGAGTSDRIEGKAKQLFGDARQGAGDVNEQAERATEQFEYRADQGAEGTERAIDRANDGAKRSAENAVDAVKGFFNR